MMPQRALIAASKARKLQDHIYSLTDVHNGHFELLQSITDSTVSETAG